jgi:hypothetical protein
MGAGGGAISGAGAGADAAEGMDGAGGGGGVMDRPGGGGAMVVVGSGFNSRRIISLTAAEESTPQLWQTNRIGCDTISGVRSKEYFAPQEH